MRVAVCQPELRSVCMLTHIYSIRHYTKTMKMYVCMYKCVYVIECTLTLSIWHTYSECKHAQIHTYNFEILALRVQAVAYIHA
jgi:hypothetical protein